jgi:hypothetical protein
MPADPTLFLPGNLPGLLRRGSPVLHGWSPEHPGRETLVIDLDDPDEDQEPAALCVNDYSTDYGAQWYRLADLHLDLSDPTGRLHAAMWLAERVGVPATGYRGIPLASAGIIWHRDPPIGWRLSTWNVNHGASFAADVRGLIATHRVPALAAIDLTDPLADVRALVACCLHVAGEMP